MHAFLETYLVQKRYDAADQFLAFPDCHMVNELLIILVVYIQAIEEDLDLMCTLLKQRLSAIKHNISNKIIYKDKHKMLFYSM